MYKLIFCQNQQDYQLAQAIAHKYVQWLGMDLSFQHIDLEWSQFETMYGIPDGGYVIAVTPNNQVVAGVGFRKLNDTQCEMKRLFVLEEHGGHGLGRALCIEAMKQAKERGYQSMVLDTVARLRAANYLYETLGFQDIAPYTENPDPTARFMEASLSHFDASILESANQIQTDSELTSA